MNEVHRSKNSLSLRAFRHCGMNGSSFFLPPKYYISFLWMLFSSFQICSTINANKPWWQSNPIFQFSFRDKLTSQPASQSAVLEASRLICAGFFYSPDQTSEHFRGWKPVVQRILSTSETSTEGFRDTKAVKGSVGFILLLLDRVTVSWASFFSARQSVLLILRTAAELRECTSGKIYLRFVSFVFFILSFSFSSSSSFFFLFLLLLLLHVIMLRPTKAVSFKRGVSLQTRRKKDPFFPFEGKRESEIIKTSSIVSSAENY